MLALFYFPLLRKEQTLFKTKALYWANRYNAFLCLDNHHYHHPYQQKSWILGCAQNPQKFSWAEGKHLNEMPVSEASTLWLGHITYDYRLQLFPKLTTKKQPYISFPAYNFFIPEILLEIKDETLLIHAPSQTEAEAILGNINGQNISGWEGLATLQFDVSKNKAEYLQDVKAIQTHIKNGDCYELNYCVERTAQVAEPINLIAFAHTLFQVNPAPFAAVYKWDKKFVVSSSPERFLSKQGKKIIAQPIKGTARRSKDEQEDEAIKKALAASIKDKAEHVMIVDLMRNDLALSAIIGSVQVEEFMKIYSYPQVHQMISTITAELKEDVTATNAIEQAFPMGSMTGAPKLKVMQLIDQYEGFARGIFSGSLGYLTAQGDFDLNVLIRSVVYDEQSGRLSFATGGAITYDSHPEEEYEEMMLKGRILEHLLKNGG